MKRIFLLFLLAYGGLCMAQVMGGTAPEKLIAAARAGAATVRPIRHAHRNKVQPPVHPAVAAPPVDDKAAILREQLRAAEAQRDLVAAEARASSYKEQIDSFRQTAADARAAAREGRWTVLAVLAITPLIVVLILVVQAVRNGQESRARLRKTVEAGVLPGVKESAELLVAKVTGEFEQEVEDVRSYLDKVAAEVKRDRVCTLDGLRLFFYRQAYDFKSRGAWGRAMMFTIYALLAEFEAAELTGEESRFKYARVALANHGKLLVEHVEDYARETDQAWWDTRDLEQIRALKRFAGSDLVPTLTLLEQHTLNSVERIQAGSAPAA